MGLGEGRGKLFFRNVPPPFPNSLMPGNTIFFQLILHQTLGYAEQFRGFGLYEVGADERAADKRGFDALKGIGKIKLHRKQIHGALELRFLVADLGGQILKGDHVSGHEHKAAFDHVLQLPDVAGPLVAGKMVQRFGGKRLGRDAVFLGGLFREVATSSGISSRRSRRGGIGMCTTLRR